MKERFTVPSIVLSVSRLVLQSFVANYNYKNGFEEGLLRLKNMAAELGEEGEKLVKNFESKKYSMEGAALPDVMLEDVDGKMHKLTDFRGKYLYIDLWASWCGPCRMQSPIIDQLAAAHSNVVFGKVNVDEEADLAAEYGITSIPTLIIFRDGRLIDQVTGVTSKASIERMLGL